MDLIRLLLFQIEGEQEPDLSDYSNKQIQYHQRLLIEADLVHGIAEEVLGGDFFINITQPTWKGHEFIEAARNDSIWNKVKGRVSKLNTAMTLPILLELLTAIAKEQAGLGN